MNLGLFEGWAAGGAASMTPGSTGATVPVDPAEAATLDPAFRRLMDLFASPVHEPAIEPGVVPAASQGSPAEATVVPAREGLIAPVDVSATVITFAESNHAIGVNKIETPGDDRREPAAVIDVPGFELPAAAPPSEPEHIAAISSAVVPAGALAFTPPAPVDRATEPSAPALSVDQQDSGATFVSAAMTPAHVIEQPVALPNAPSLPAAVSADDRFAPRVEQAAVRAAIAVAPAIAQERPHGQRAAGRQPPVEAPQSAAPVIMAAATEMADSPATRDDDSVSESFRNAGRHTSPAPSIASGHPRTKTDGGVIVFEPATRVPQSPVSAPSADVPVRPSLKAPAPSLTFTAPIVHTPYSAVAAQVPMTVPVQSPAPVSLPATTAAQIVQSIQLAWSRDGGEAKMTLDPEQFGDLSVVMRVDRGQVVARVQADAPVVREWLQTNQDTLRAGLAEHHLRLDRLDVAAADDSRESAAQKDADRRDAHESRSQGRRPRRQTPHQTFHIDA